VATIAAAVGWLFGLYLGPGLPRLGPIEGAALLAALLGLGALWRGVPLARVGTVAAIATLLGVARGQVVEPGPGPGSVLELAGLGPVELRGRIVDEPERSGVGYRLRVAAAEARGRASAGTTYGVVLATVPDGDWRYGDEVIVTGPLEQPVDRDAIPLAEVFARRGLAASLRATDARLARREGEAALGGAQLEVGPPSERLAEIGSGWRDAAWGRLYALKAGAGDVLDRRLPAPASALARGLLLGGTTGMPPDLVESFRRSGMSHVVAVSGYNVTLVAAAVLPLGRFAGRGGGVALAALAVVAFTAATGAPASALRAAIMSLLALLARLVGRPPDAVAALAVAALAMTAYDPGLLNDLGFLLSSLATLAIVAVYPWLDARLPGHSEPLQANGLAAPGAMLRADGVGLGGDDAAARVAALLGPEAPTPPESNLTAVTAASAGGGESGGQSAWAGAWAAVRETVVATLAVELLTVPLMAVAFGRIALLSLVANLLVLPAVPVAMALGLAVALTGPLPDWLAAPLGWLAWVPLAWIVAAVELCAAPDWAALPLGRVGAAAAWVYYVVAALLLLSAHAAAYRLAAPSPVRLLGRALDRIPTPVALGGALLIAMAAWAAAFSAPDGAARLTFFEESGAALLRTAGGRNVLLDPGSNPRALAADLGRTLPFTAGTIDLVVLPRESLGGEAIPDLLRRYNVGQIATPPERDETPTSAPRPGQSNSASEQQIAARGAPEQSRWRTAAAAARVPIVEPDAGTLLPIDAGLRLELLTAPIGAPMYALRLSAGDHGVLLLGTGEATTQRAFADLLNGPVEIVRLGADAAPLEPLLRERLDPTTAIVQVRPGFPRPTTRQDERLRVLRSDDHGTIELTLRPSGIEVRSRR
jgi:competence protein ComEC